MLNTYILSCYLHIIVYKSYRINVKSKFDLINLPDYEIKYIVLIKQGIFNSLSIF